MYFLAGLLGMMALGSVAIVSTAGGDPTDGDDLPEVDPTLEDGTETVLDTAAPLVLGPEQSVDAADLAEAHDVAQDDAVAPAGAEAGSLFARMGVINMPFDAADSGAEEVAWLAGTPDDEADLDDLRAPDADDGAAQGFDTLIGAWEDDLPAATEATTAVVPDLADIDEDDQVIIVFDDSADAPEPEVHMRPNSDDPEVTEIVLNGEVVSTVATAEAPPPNALVLLGESLMNELALT